MVTITISGKACAGKDTTSNILGKKLEKYGFKVIKATLKTFAKEKGLDILEFEKIYAENSEEWDRKLDEWQREVVKKYKNCILVSMLAAYNVPDAELKVFLTASEAERAKRAMKRDGIPKEKALEYIRERDRVFRKRIRRIYGIDPWDPKLYDVIIDNTNMTPEETVEKIMFELKERNLLKNFDNDS
ncbi:MAG: cytidylate kinase family protein [Candidatus Aenigmarchaeota archaeon]|nr:cytidylate kinase family protein [Candidatus Aenigmarchaeota archaeon]